VRVDGESPRGYGNHLTSGHSASPSDRRSGTSTGVSPIVPNPPAEPIESTDPNDPIDRNDPVDPIENADANEPMENAEPPLRTDAADPPLAAEAQLKIDANDADENSDHRERWLVRRLRWASVGNTGAVVEMDMSCSFCAGA
jgi:hypothetical protein